ncbi:RNA polymerase sigma factor [Lunatibacter salilacus]|uniref:RNA polymerase sigma factor n=1 Tax=Lunatibacter salilacus TaxID=2483804 RepID=UPI00131DF9CA|nr:sigma-70 family RNA polymerase sigma factor [Lunatibacter salilacus]
MKNIDDTYILSGLLEGGIKRPLFERKLYEHFFYLIKQGAWKYGLDEDVCASVYSDTVINVIENVVTGRYHAKSSLKTYAYRIFMNKCVDEMRKNSTNKGKVNNKTKEIDSLILNLPDKAAGIVQQMIDKSDKLLLMQKVEELGEKCRKLLLLFEDGYNDKEIAQQMEYNSAEVVKTTRLRCLEKLREKVFSKKQND